MFSRPFLTLLGLGLLGAIPVFLFPTNPQHASSGIGTGLVLLITLAAAVAIGVALAERVGAVSLILRRVRNEPQTSEPQHWLRTIDLACIVGVCLIELSLLTWWLFPEAYGEIAKYADRLDPSRTFWSDSVLGLTFYAITCELILRFGLVTLILWLGGSTAESRGPASLTWAALLIPPLLMALVSLILGSPVSWPILFYEGIGVAVSLFLGWLYVSKALEHAILASMVISAVYAGLALFLAIFSLS
ncbi:hypothetical protein MHY87_08830 [Microvirga sp. ACRRW]|uniref:hypothetical protein n=1 Tax=Microvirga sp. ACRRW TaxID=2918205 RepID=UPI001EF59B9D|nr:hypothetical protein [Microvirga sp. ACRRW]MCG7393006.1 hypothetical protein [Microvirga sp. ACRRW]